MQVVILAGGKGTRLQPLTHNVPKPMIPVNEKPFLQYQLNYIRNFGLVEIILLVGYLADQIEEYFGDGSKFDMNIQYSIEDHSLGTGGALKNAQDKLMEDILLLNGDTFLPIDYLELIDHFHGYNTMAILTASNNSEIMAPNNVAIVESNRVVDYNKRDPKGMTHVDSGALVLKKEILDFFPEGRVCSLEEDIFPELIKRKVLKAFITGERFYDMGTIEGLKLIEGVLL